MPASSEEIERKLDRLDEIAATLEAGEIDLATAKELREEADELLETLREELAHEEGELVEVDPES